MWILTCRTVLLRLVVTQWDRLVMSGAPQVMREAHFSLKGRVSIASICMKAPCMRYFMRLY